MSKSELKRMAELNPRQLYEELAAAQQTIQQKDEQIAMLRDALTEISTFPRYRMPADIAKEALSATEAESSAWMQKRIDEEVVNALESVRDYKGYFLEWYDYIDDLIAKRKGGE